VWRQSQEEEEERRRSHLLAWRQSQDYSAEWRD